MCKTTLVLAVLLVLAIGCGAKSTAPTPTAPTSNRSPQIGSVAVAPAGIGLFSATIYTLVAEEARDPDGDALTYAWNFGDGESASTQTSAVSHVYMFPGTLQLDGSGQKTFDVQVIVTDARGLSASAQARVRIGTVTGTWDVTCDGAVYSDVRGTPRAFVVTLTQSGRLLFGSMTADGRSRRFTYDGEVSNPRRVGFGVETSDNVWNRDGDFYFTLDADDTLRTMVGRAHYCRSSTARKR